jgi:hypothetical protein
MFVGYDLGSLTVFALNDVKNINQKIYSRNGTHGDEWVKAIVALSHQDYTFDFSLAFDSIAGKKLEGW